MSTPKETPINDTIGHIDRERRPNPFFANAPIDMRLWGRDHWSTFAYAETCAVEKQPLDNRRMRCNHALHPYVAHGMNGTAPTRLKEGTPHGPHDDWSCLEDAHRAGLLTTTREPAGYDQPYGMDSVRVTLTRKGRAIASALRQHKANGGSFATFEPPTIR